jgi:hypothetical protein
MGNRYVEFVKKYAKDNDISYHCAMCEIQTNKLYLPLSKDEQRTSSQRDKTFIKLSKLNSKLKSMQRDVRDAEKNNNEKKTRASLRKFELLKVKFNKNADKHSELLKLFDKLDREKDELEEHKSAKPKAAPKPKAINEVEKAYNEYADKMKDVNAYMYKNRAFTPGTTDVRQLGELRDNYNIAVKNAGLKSPKELPGFSGKRRPFHDVNEFKSKEFLIDAINEFLLKKKVKISDLSKQSLPQLIDGIIRRELDVDPIAKIYNRKIREAMEPFLKSGNKDKWDKLYRLSISGGRLYSSDYD